MVRVRKLYCTNLEIRNNFKTNYLLYIKGLQQIRSNNYILLNELINRQIEMFKSLHTLLYFFKFVYSRLKFEKS